jgi:hypothetical protein
MGPSSVTFRRDSLRVHNSDRPPAGIDMLHDDALFAPAATGVNQIGEGAAQPSPLMDVNVTHLNQTALRGVLPRQLKRALRLDVDRSHEPAQQRLWPCHTN